MSYIGGSVTVDPVTGAHSGSGLSLVLFNSRAQPADQFDTTTPKYGMSSADWITALVTKKQGIAVQTNVEGPALAAYLNVFGSASTTAPSAAISTVETFVTTPLAIPANTMAVGTSYRVRLWGTCTSAAAGVSTVFTVRIGDFGTTGDAGIATILLTSAAAGTNVPFFVEFDVTVRGPLTATCSVVAAGKCENNGVTGVSASPQPVVGTAATANVDATADNHLNVSVVTGAASVAVTVQMAITETTKA